MNCRRSEVFEHKGKQENDKFANQGSKEVASDSK